MISATALRSCIAEQWSPTIGDPSVIGWLTVAAYGFAALLCLRARRNSHVRWFWLILALLLFALMINKQLDLQSALTASARCLSQMQGWYEDRKSVQIGFIIVVVFSGFWISLVSLWFLRKHLREVGIALIGFVTLICFVMIRAAGFHNFDAFLGAEIMSIRMNWLLELSGITLIAANAAWVGRRRQPRGMEYTE